MPSPISTEFWTTLVGALIILIASILAIFSVIWLLNKTKMGKDLTRLIMAHILDNVITENMRIALSRFFETFPDLVDKHIRSASEKIITEVSKCFEGQAFTVQHLTIIQVGKDISVKPETVYSPEIPDAISEKYPEIKKLEELSKNPVPNSGAIIAICDESLKKYWKQKDRYCFIIYKARALLALGKADEACENLSEAKTLRPEDPEIYFILAKCESERREYIKAESDYKKAIEFNENEPKYFGELGLFYWKQNRLDEALVAANKAHEIYERNKVNRDSYNYLELHNELEFYCCLKFAATKERTYLERAEEINSWFEANGCLDKVKGKKPYFEDTMGYYYCLKATTEGDLRKKMEILRKAYKYQISAAAKLPDPDVRQRLTDICVMMDQTKDMIPQ